MNSEMRMRSSTLKVVAGGICLLALLVVAGPTRGQGDANLPGIDSGNYNVKQTAEFGYRYTNTSGNRNTYNTFLNLNPGPRLLEYSLEMRSLNHQGWLLDNLYLTNFGYGGDPNDVTRLRAYKNKWYNFNATFRRDRNFWDYTLLANPLNPPNGFTNTPDGFNPLVSSSPHRFETTRRLGDYNLTLLPQSHVRFRLGYSRNISEGPSFSSFHEGTDVRLFQDWKTTVNSYQAGVDFKIFPRTNISYDQFLRYYKGDTSYVDRDLNFFLANGTPVDLGLPFNAAGAQPCATPFNTSPKGTVNPACNGYLGYTRQARVRTSYPAEQLSFQSNYFKKLDFAGRLVYSGADMDTGSFSEVLRARVTRTNLRDRTELGPIEGRRVSTSADLGATWHVANKLRILDNFRFSNFRIPGTWQFTFCNFFGTSLASPSTVFSATTPLLASCTAPSNGVAGAAVHTGLSGPNGTVGVSSTPTHTNSSGPDVAVGVSSLFLKQDLKNNLFELEYDFTRRLGARLGYRFRHRTIGDADFESGTFVFFPDRQNARALPAPFNVDETGATVTCPAGNNRADGSCLITPEPLADSGETEINEHSALVGLWVRPTDALRVSFDVELMSADNAFTRISPRQLQHYKLRSSYKPAHWVSLGLAVNILENRDNVPDINNLQHNRSFGFSAVFEPSERFSFDIGYDYNDVFSQTDICFVSSTAPKGLAKCPGSTVLVQEPSRYTSTTHFGYVNLMWKPLRRLTTRLGYSATGTDGGALLLNPNAPPATLNYKYQKPYGGFAVDIAKGLTWKTNWSYYGYNEEEVVLPIDTLVPRDFRGNHVTVALRYAF